MSKQQIKIDTNDIQSLEDIIKLIKDKVEPQIRNWEDLYYQDLVKRYNEFKTDWNNKLQNGDKTPYWNIYPNYLNKSEYNIIYGRSENNIKELLKKEGDKKLLRIDTAVRKKVIDVIKEVQSGEIYSSIEMGEIDGSFKLITVEGETKFLEFESILAGGYNIQKLHFRTLFKYK